MASALLLASSAFAQTPTYSWYGFIRNYFTYDTHESVAGTEDFYYYMPKDNDNKGTSNFAALTSRIGLDVKGYEVSGYKVGAKMEADFYCKSGTTAILRMRQAYLTLAKEERTWKIGQAWHPMAQDLPDIFSLDSGMPFGPFSRTPQINLEYNAGQSVSFNAAALWQMQYTSAGPNGQAPDYIKKSGIPEIFVGLNFKEGSSLIKLGVDVLSIKPHGNANLTTVNFFQYGQTTQGNWTLKEKIVYAQDGSHMNMIGGYGVSGINTETGNYSYTPCRNLSAWATLAYKKSKEWVPSILIGAIKCFGTNERVLEPIVGATTDAMFYTNKTADKVSAMYRLQPEIVYNLGKVQFGAEYMLTAVHYGTPNEYKQATENLHWVKNNRFQLMVKYSF